MVVERLDVWIFSLYIDSVSSQEGGWFIGAQAYYLAIRLHVNGVILLEVPKPSELRSYYDTKIKETTVLSNPLQVSNLNSVSKKQSSARYCSMARTALAVVHFQPSGISSPCFEGGVVHALRHLQRLSLLLSTGGVQ